MKKILMLTILFVFGFSIPMEAQFLEKLAKKAEEKAKREAEERAERRVEKGIDNVYDKTEEEIDKAGQEKSDESEKNSKTKKDKKNSSKEVTEKNESESDKTAPFAESPKSTRQEPGLQSYSKFDFIPGEKVIFFDDFSQDAVGDFPALWYSNGSGEVVTFNNYPGNYLIIKAPGFYYPEKDLLTTDNFTIEFDLIPVTNPEDDRFNFQFNIVSGNVKNRDWDTDYPGKAGFKTSIANGGIYFDAFADNAPAGNGKKETELDPHQKMHFSYWIQKTRVRLYINETKVVDAPRILPEGHKYNLLMFYMTTAYNPSCAVSNFRVAAGLPDMRSKLLTEGKLVSYGIYFDVNKDVVKPESYGTLKEIAQVLKDNPTLKIKIVGHTDSDGDDTSNLDLSKRRGNSVKNELVKTFGIEVSRIESDGAGETKPVTANDTPANKALNRRVEFIKL